MNIWYSVLLEVNSVDPYFINNRKDGISVTSEERLCSSYLLLSEINFQNKAESTLKQSVSASFTTNTILDSIVTKIWRAIQGTKWR